MKILFYDVVTPLAYHAHSMEEQALGGTESTIIRIAHALAKHHDIYVAQHCRNSEKNQLSAGVNYLSLETAQQLKPDVVILLRDYHHLGAVAQFFPQARRYLWLHNMPSRGLYAARADLSRYQFEVLAVSQFHRSAIQKRLAGNWLQGLLNRKDAARAIPIHVIYNPIDDHLIPDQTPVKPEQLLFMSSPQKGLPETLKLFEQVRQYYPEYQLLIANPGYQQMTASLPAQARFLGALPHKQVLQYLRESFCVFYPQCLRVETFGLVYAEANAVGTPVLAHDSGAAKEVLSDAGQLVNGHELDSILEKLAQWRELRPKLQGKNEFRLSQVTQAWLKLLESR